MLLISGGIDELGLGSHHRDSGARNSRDAWARSQRYVGKIEYEKIEFLKMTAQQILTKDSKHEILKTFQFLDDAGEAFGSAHS